DGGDESALSPPTVKSQARTVTIDQFIVYSATFQVPTFYFSAHQSDGSTLGLGDIEALRLLKAHSRPDSEINSYAITPIASPFPLLSQGDHPTLGTPCWYFHPCETSTAVQEILHEIGEMDWEGEDGLARWMGAWFSVLSSAVDL
ncbi:hypothetical protein SISSUDRAFT_961116, partial [Sistotremastrum suecicum HHB10207 ss-3]